MKSSQFSKKVLKAGLMGAVASGMAIAPAKAIKKTHLPPSQPTHKSASKRKDNANIANSAEIGAMVTAAPETLSLHSGLGPCVAGRR